jgi:hypothetical protein
LRHSKKLEQTEQKHMTVSINKSPASPATLPKRRMGRGKLVFPVKYRGRNPRSAELDPEATTDQVDQTLTKLSLKAVNSDKNSAILSEHEEAADRLAHIESSLPAKQRAVLIKVLAVVEPGDSLREIARNAGLHPPQVSRAFEAAREAEKLRISKQANREKRPPAVSYTPYHPRGVPMEIVMMPHQGPTLSTIGVPDRWHGSPTISLPTNGCSHPNRQWLRVGFGGLGLTCLDCKVELERAGILSKP